MKYFTPELVVAYGSDDPATWKDAERRWDAVCEQYDAYLASINEQFPPGLRHVEDHYSLHDAVIRGMGRRDGAFVVMLQLDTPPQPLLTLTYDLAEGPVIREGVLPPEYRSTGGQVDWQYDEVEQGPGEPPTWRHSVLLSNGWEVILHFRDVRAEEAQALIPAPRNGAALPGAGLPQPA